MITSQLKELQLLVRETEDVAKGFDAEKRSMRVKGQHIRKQMQLVRSLAKNIRDNVQEIRREKVKRDYERISGKPFPVYGKEWKIPLS